MYTEEEYNEFSNELLSSDASSVEVVTKEKVSKEKATKDKVSKEKVTKDGSKEVERYTPHMLWRERCKTCPNCVKPDCSKCVCCRGNQKNTDPATKNCCLQKVG